MNNLKISFLFIVCFLLVSCSTEPTSTPKFTVGSIVMTKLSNEKVMVIKVFETPRNDCRFIYSVRFSNNSQLVDRGVIFDSATVEKFPTKLLYEFELKEYK